MNGKAYEKAERAAKKAGEEARREHMPLHEARIDAHMLMNIYLKGYDEAMSGSGRIG